MLVALALAGCDRPRDSATITVSAIGGRPVLGDPGRGSLDLPSRLLTDAVAQGLVRFDAAGQIEPGLAERWIVTRAGASYIFRLREARWADGTPVTADQVVARLKRQIGPASRNPLAPFLTAIDEIVAMTPQVIEIRLVRPRPDLLKLFAQPEMGIVGTTRQAGSGPLQSDGGRRVIRLDDMPEAAADDDGSGSAKRPNAAILFRGERAASAVARFLLGRSDLVTGGGLADWPLAAGVAAPQVRIDPAAGLFGLAIVSRAGFLADVANRTALAQAIDPAALTTAVAPDWPVDQRLLPDALDSAAPPSSPAWATVPLEQRRADVRARVAAWPAPVVLRIGMPDGPGATQLWGQLAAATLRVGIRPTRVPLTAPAELRLVDAVAPYDSARWYLAMACRPCGAVPLTLILAARDAATIADRARRLAQADAALTADIAFIPIARPLRWSLVAPRLRQWQPNTRAWHPLNRLRFDANGGA